ncbi:MAG: hypothetical protein WCH75_23150 [Candidatus Binatia bacterium]
MAYLLFAFLGMAGGGLAMFIATEAKRKRLHDGERQQEAQAEQNQIQLIDLRRREEQLAEQDAGLKSARHELDRRVVSYKELGDENGLLKRDLRNLAITLRKL